MRIAPVRMSDLPLRKLVLRPWRLELAALFVIDRHAAHANVIDPAMQRKIACQQAICDGWMRLQVLQLRDHVLFGKREQKLGVRLSLAALDIRITQPVPYGGERR